ncbi:MAG: hypothetical protein ACLQOZ_16160 [Acidimicrobiales bacterium]
MAGTTSTVAPIIGSSHTSFAKQEWVAGGIVVGLALVVIGFRRYCAARSATWGAGESVLYAVFLRTRVPPGSQAPTARGLLVGQDNRFSTSKTTAAMWTALLIYFIVAMALVLGFARSRFDALIGGISPLYLVFLGGPFAAAVMAKATVSGAVGSGDQQKSQAASPQVADVFSDDDGNTDLVDLQYLAFNLVVAAIVLVEFVHAPGYGAPAVPDFLAGLTGASAATYVTNKALVSGNPPAISRLSPSTTRPGGQVIALGANLIAQGDSSHPTVFVNNGSAIGATDDPPSADQATFRLPVATPFGGASVVVHTPSGLETSPSTLQVVADALVVGHAAPTETMPNTTITLLGAGFYDATDVDADGNPGDGAIPAVVTLTGRTKHAEPHQCLNGRGTDTQLTVTVPADILTRDEEAAGWFDVHVARGSLQAAPNIAINVQ